MLPAPNLDDRTFQSLVDDARRLVHRRCPEWSDHNISDPGITLIETFAMMVDQLIYRLNRVPDRNYIKFLELLGLELRAPGAAQGEVTFWLSAPQLQPITVREETEVSTDRTDVDEPIVFSTTEKLDIVPCSLESGRLATGSERGRSDRSTQWDVEFRCFSERPSPGDALLIGLDNAVPSCAVLLRVDCRVSGVGVDPTNPPYVWEAWTGGPDWVQCELERDETKAFNKPGDVILHVPRGHVLGSPASHQRGSPRLAQMPIGGAGARPINIQRVSVHHVDRRLHHRWHRSHRSRPRHPRRGHRDVGRHTGTTFPPSTSTGAALVGQLAIGDHRRGNHRMEPGGSLWRGRRIESVLPHRPGRRGGGFRAGGP